LRNATVPDYSDWRKITEIKILLKIQDFFISVICINLCNQARPLLQQRRNRHEGRIFAARMYKKTRRLQFGFYAQKD